MYRAGLSYQQAHSGVGRDASSLEKALELYTKFLEQFPDSVYAPAVKKFRAEVVAGLAEHEKKIIAFYKKKNKDKAAEAREKVVMAKWDPLVSQTAYHEETKVDAPVGVKVEEVPVPLPVQGAPSKASRDGMKITSGTTTAPNRILRVTCNTAGARGLFIYLAKPLADPEFVRKSASIAPRNGELIVPVPGVEARAEKIDCFGSEDVSVSDAGVVRLKSDSVATILALENPARLYVAIPD